MQPKSSPAALFLGIDTGGTYTDAVLWSEAAGVAAKAKALTTRHDLAVGISGAVDAVLATAAVAPASIKLVSMSTTLATNALVEGQGGRVALVMIGFSEADLARDGLRAHSAPTRCCSCRAATTSTAMPHRSTCRRWRPRCRSSRPSVSGFAVCAYFAVRNPAHENAARELIRQKTGLPVTASHELSAKLGGPRRALTTLLNARLIAMIDRLVAATEGFLQTARHRRTADGGARRRRAGVGGVCQAAADRDHSVRPGRQPGRRPPHDRPRRRPSSPTSAAPPPTSPCSTTAGRGSIRKAPRSAASAPWSRRSPCAPSGSAAIPKWRWRMAG